MQQHGPMKREELTMISNQAVEAPEIVQQAVKRIERAITYNEYDSHNYQSMVLKCIHLTNGQQQILIELFAQYSSLFHGSVGKLPYVKVHLELKPNSKSFGVRAYTVSSPQHFTHCQKRG